MILSKLIFVFLRALSELCVKKYFSLLGAKRSDVYSHEQVFKPSNSTKNTELKTYVFLCNLCGEKLFCFTMSNVKHQITLRNHFPSLISYFHFFAIKNTHSI